ncbi:trypsin-like serine peptidase [Paenarthrobacter sp. NPDC089714]|uniref:trypsin-like serine peptidase n=1 Tax=Paenarthrobacter sp. NPDC089714 TaxID=3364377 RepID=UPI0037FE5742
MTKTKTLATSLLSLSAAAILALVGTTSANAAPVKDIDSSGAAVSSHVTQDAGAADYWTPERMKSAKNGDVLAAKALQRTGLLNLGKAPVTEAPGAVTSIEGQQASTDSKAINLKVNQSESPVKHIGKIFFTLGGSNYVCSGNSVTAANKSTVSTAGHCVNEGPGAYATNFVFVPAYLNGSAPYGKWTAKALYSPTQWASSGNMQYDTAFAVVNTLNGQKLADVVGSSGVQFNAARGLSYKSFGYPAAPPFNGESLKSCSGTATNDPYNPQFNTQGIPCNMTGGSSGGPWFIGNSSSGYQNSVNSYGYGSNSTTMYGPYWGSVIQSTYTTAAAS